MSVGLDCPFCDWAVFVRYVNCFADGETERCGNCSATVAVQVCTESPAVAVEVEPPDVDWLMRERDSWRDRANAAEFEATAIAQSSAAALTSQRKARAQGEQSIEDLADLVDQLRAELAAERAR